MVNLAGATFPERLRASAGCDTLALTFAFEAARQVFRLDEAWSVISGLDLKIPAEAQLALYHEVSVVLRRQTFWLARRAARGATSVQALIDAYRPAADALRKEGPSILSDFEQGVVARRTDTFMGLGAPPELSAAIALLRPLTATSDVADLAGALGWPTPSLARIYHQVGAAFDFDRLRGAAGALASSDHFERLAVRRLIEDLLAEQAALAGAVAKASSPGAGASRESARRAVNDFIGDRKAAVDAVRRTVEEIEQSGSGWSFAKLTIANSALRELASGA
jgi:glutamate dehydrogenase